MVLLVAKYLLLFVTHSPYQVPILLCSNFISLNIPDVPQVYCLIVGGVLQRGQSFTLALHCKTYVIATRERKASKYT